MLYETSCFRVLGTFFVVLAVSLTENPMAIALSIWPCCISVGAYRERITIPVLRWHVVAR